MMQKGNVPRGNDGKVRERRDTLDFENEGRGQKSEPTGNAASRSCGSKQQLSPAEPVEGEWLSPPAQPMHSDPIWPGRQQTVMLQFHTQEDVWGLSRTSVPHQMG